MVVVEELMGLSISKFLEVVRLLDNDSKQYLIDNFDKFDKYHFNFYFVLPSDLKIKLLQRKDFFEMFVNAPRNKLKRSNFYLSDIEVKKYVLSRREWLDRDTFYGFLGEIDKKDFLEVTRGMDFYDSLALVPEELERKLGWIDLGFSQKVKRGRRTLYALLRVDNECEFFLYDKFGVLVKAYQEGSNVVLENSAVIPLRVLQEVNAKDMEMLMSLLKTKDDKADDDKLLVVALKLYATFGFDNSKKIIEDKFTFITEKMINRASRVHYIDWRRNYRLNNQHKFYSYDMLVKAIGAAATGDYLYFKNVCLDTSEDNLRRFCQQFKELVDEGATREMLKAFLNGEIMNREGVAETVFEDSYTNNLRAKAKRDPLLVRELYNRLERVGFDNVRFDVKGRTVLESTLVGMLLGNYKWDNDCLLRLILNDEAMGLNNSLDVLIDDFYQLEYEIRKNGMSINSLLDIIDAVKARFYNLEFDQMDISLTTLTKIFNSRVNCDKGFDEILATVVDFRRKARKKYCSFIPYVSGKLENGYRYEVVLPSYEGYVAMGIDSGDCFKVGGAAQDFLEACMTRPFAEVIAIYDEKDKRYICPCVRSGNAIIGNGFDPELPEDKVDEFLEVLRECYRFMAEQSWESEKIEMGTITDLHIKSFIDGQKLEAIVNPNSFLDNYFYNDFDKKDTRNFILYRDSELVSYKWYVPSITYDKPRESEGFCLYDSSQLIEQTEVMEKINGIVYSSIDFEAMTDLEKMKKRETFLPLEGAGYQYVISNNDWCVLVDYDKKITGFKASLDPRVEEEMLEGYKVIESLISPQKGYTRKINLKKNS